MQLSARTTPRVFARCREEGVENTSNSSIEYWISALLSTPR